MAETNGGGGHYRIGPYVHEDEYKAFCRRLAIVGDTFSAWLRREIATHNEQLRWFIAAHAEELGQAERETA